MNRNAPVPGRGKAEKVSAPRSPRTPCRAMRVRQRPGTGTRLCSPVQFARQTQGRGAWFTQQSTQI